jgi:hypothetical protein
LMLGLAACERPATKSTWSPIDEANKAATAAALPKTLKPVETGDPAAATATAAPADKPTPTLDLTTLPAQLPHSMKGYNLYSWQVGQVWNFTLVTGTNARSFDDITTFENTLSDDGFVKLTFSGIDELKEVLARLPKSEEVLWSGFDLGGEVPTGTVFLTLPPQEMIDEIITYCSGLGIHLTAIKP